jgi:hypothetical protein
MVGGASAENVEKHPPPRLTTKFSLGDLFRKEGRFDDLKNKLPLFAPLKWNLFNPGICHRVVIF